MEEYHKIQTIFKRNPETKFKTLLMNEYSLPEFEYLKNNEWVFTEKVDGTNIRIMYENKEIRFGGKTNNAQIPILLLDGLNKIFNSKRIDKLINIFGDTSVCLYGEGYGAKIQKGGGNYRHDNSFVLFDIKIGDYWLQRKDVDDIAVELDIDTVPVIGSGSLDDLILLVQSGFKSTWGDFIAEGVVARPSTELKTRSGHRIITKLKYRDFQGGGLI